MYKSHYSIWDAKSDVSLWGKAYTYHRARKSLVWLRAFG